MKKVIITGAEGFIGRHVKQSLLESGYFLFSLDRKDVKGNNDKTVQITTDLATGRAVEECVDQIKSADIMLHLAADITVPGDTQTIGSNIDSMCAALEIAKRCGIRQFVFLSSIPVIGKILYTPIDEEHRVMPETPYHWSKYLCERMLDNYRDYFESTAIIRIPSPIGVGMRRGVFLPVLLEKMLRGEDIEIYGTGSRIQNYIDVRDLSEALLQVVKYKADGLYLISGIKSYSNMELARICKQITKSVSDLHVGLHEDPEESQKWVISHKKAEEAFGFQPKYYIEDTIRWMYGENL